MNQSKIWSYGVIFFVIGFVGTNFLIWKIFTEKLLTFGELNGDLSRVGYIHGASYSEKKSYGLGKKHLENKDYNGQPIDVMTIGDSFSNGCGKEDQFYQDYIATFNQMTVLNIQKFSDKNSIDTVITLCNSGFFEKYEVKSIVIQMVERNVTDSFSKEFNWEQKLPLEEIEEHLKNEKYTLNPRPLGFLNPGNFKFVLYHFLYKIKDNAFFSKVYMVDLTKPMFDVKKSKKLIFAFEDIEHLNRENKERIKKVNDTLNRLSQNLSDYGVVLYFMPVVDKYNLYSDYLVKNSYPKSNFFEMIRPLEKKYILIDTKEILGSEVRKGEKDIYYADDTHWSWKAPMKIFETIKFQISK